ncbi:MAG: hypothetical protein BWZ10_01947 [candidate division BRC1 bacterium ADurb.BinA364]|nr:MAG: hypothetical protein BWZ10_01947 [candidate division BRC1 bacterium ADurb.BinA364]
MSGKREYFSFFVLKERICFSMRANKANTTIVFRRCLDRAAPDFRAGFTLLETMIAVILVAITGLGLISAVVVSRELAELDKQRLAAISIARNVLEEQARRSPFPSLQPISDMTIDNFNTPETADDLNASLDLQLFEVEQDGSRGAELFAPPSSPQLIEVLVTIEWNRTGRRSSKRVQEQMSTYVYPDL